jgi:hypothetical protein
LRHNGEHDQYDHRQQDGLKGIRPSIRSGQHRMAVAPRFRSGPLRQLARTFRQ